MLLNLIELEKSITTIDNFLNYFYVSDINLYEGMLLDLDLGLSREHNKPALIANVATETDANDISSVFKNAYNQTYPFKMLEDSREILRMIKSPEYIWIIYKLDSDNPIGCLGAQLDFENKLGYLFGFALKQKYQGNVDSLKAFILSLVFLWKEFQDKIFIWKSEVRTNSSVPQFANALVSLKPIGFLPNKDIFLPYIESEFLTISYFSDVLNEKRSNKNPKIIRQVLNCYRYSAEKYKLPIPKIKNPDLNLEKINKKLPEKSIIIRKETDKYGNNLISYSIKESFSFLRFLQNSINKNIEKVVYKSENHEDLIILLNKLFNFIKKEKIRYLECFVSAYEPIHQKIFYKFNCKPTGYIPCFSYNQKSNKFEDSILFTYHSGDLNPNIKNNLIPEAKKLLKNLDIFNSDFIKIYEK